MADVMTSTGYRIGGGQHSNSDHARSALLEVTILPQWSVLVWHRQQGHD
jgi:hypothetical protein